MQIVFLFFLDKWTNDFCWERFVLKYLYGQIRNLMKEKLHHHTPRWLQVPNDVQVGVNDDADDGRGKEGTGRPCVKQMSDIPWSVCDKLRSWQHKLANRLVPEHPVMPILRAENLYVWWVFMWLLDFHVPPVSYLVVRGFDLVRIYKSGCFSTFKTLSFTNFVWY